MKKPPIVMISLRLSVEEYEALQAFIEAGKATCPACGAKTKGAQGRSEFVRAAIATALKAAKNT